LAFSPGKGIFFFSPVALLGLIGMRRFVRRHRLPGIALLIIITSVVLVHARWWAWHGDWAWGPRFMVPLAPLFGVFGLSTIARALSREVSFRRVRLLLMAALLSLSIGVQVLGLAFEPSRFIDVVSAQCGIFRGGTYFREGKFPLLDDGVMLHYVPYFSPISGHLWMLRAALASDAEARSKILHAPPWGTLNPRWVPKDVDDLNTNLEQWWLQLAAAPRSLQVWSRIFVALLCLTVLGAGLLLIEQLLPAPRRSLRTPA
jgi:hypothetical protein